MDFAGGNFRRLFFALKRRFAAAGTEKAKAGVGFFPELAHPRGV